MTDTIPFILDGEEVEALPGETIWQVARRRGTEIPHLCHSPEPGYRADGNCRACMVEIEGERVLAASCIRKPRAGMVVNTASERRAARAAHGDGAAARRPAGARDRATIRSRSSGRWAERIGRRRQPLPAAGERRRGLEPRAIAVNLRRLHPLQALRARLPRGPGERRHRHGLPRPRREDRVRLRRSDGRLDLRGLRRMRAGLPDRGADGGEPARRGRHAARFEDRHVDSLCPYCGVGCQITYVKDDEILYVDGRDGPANEQRLCVKGRFGFDYIHHPHRLTKPLIRRDDAPKDGGLSLDPANPSTHFREASWDEALDRAAAGLRRRSMTATACERSPASARRRARTRRPICSRS